MLCRGSVLRALLKPRITLWLQVLRRRYRRATYHGIAAQFNAKRDWSYGSVVVDELQPHMALHCVRRANPMSATLQKLPTRTGEGWVRVYDCDLELLHFPVEKEVELVLSTR